LLAKVNLEWSYKPKIPTNGSVLNFLPEGSLAALRAADLKGVAYSVIPIRFADSGIFYVAS
jgi:hypothetical protein